MIEYKEPRADIDCYLMERFKYRKSLVRLTVDNEKQPSRFVFAYQKGRKPFPT